MPSYPFNSILFLDIETAPQFVSFNDVPDEWKKLWARKAEFLIRDKETETPESIYNRAGIYAEFGKIICITCGIISGAGSAKKLLLKSFYGDDEKILLKDFCEMINKWTLESNKYLCAHNGKEFDFPYLCRRLIVNGVTIPGILNLAGKRPWEIPHLDTMELWKFGDYKNFTSLNLLAQVLGIPTPKDDMDGSMVHDVYWKEKDLERIVIYCQKDVITVAQVLLRLYGEELIATENVEIK
jgi:predicted PolB exonuclease-like 3'-5' exonuclease